MKRCPNCHELLDEDCDECPHCKSGTRTKQGGYGGSGGKRPGN